MDDPGGALESIEIAPYDRGWPAAFEAARRELEELLAPLAVRIEHVGSTAVPGLAAKPIVDLMLGCGRLAELDAQIPRLEEVGWHYAPEFEVHLPQRRFLARPRAHPRRFHLHAVELDSDFWARHLLFRDHLRANSDVAFAYEHLKRGLAARFARDREAYTAAKTAFIEEALAEAARRAERAKRP